MKRIIQLILFLILILISTIFYFVYFANKKDVKVQINLPEEQISEQTENNQIKNLKYKVKINQFSQYIIEANRSEITYENNVEIVNMHKVTAIFTDKKNIPLTIISDNAVYNNSNYNTNFSNNIQIQYLDNLIFSDKMTLDFNNNLIEIYENVKYDGLQGTINADNIKIDLITKEIEIYMNDDKDKVEVETK
jgi:hypothetical protein